MRFERIEDALCPSIGDTQVAGQRDAATDFFFRCVVDLLRPSIGETYDGKQVSKK